MNLIDEITMNYYKRKTQCVKKIEQTIINSSKGVKTEILEYFVLKNYGFSSNFVQKTLKILEKSKIIRKNRKGNWVKA